MSDVFEGSGVKRYALRYRPAGHEPWQYPPELSQFDTLAAAQAALDAMEGSGGYQIVEKLPCLWYVPGEGEAGRSVLLRNVLAELDLDCYMLQRQTAPGVWRDCRDLQFSTRDAARQACGPVHRIVTAQLHLRYEPVEVMGNGG